MIELAVPASIKEKLKKARLYCVTQTPPPGQNYQEMTEKACRGGADIIQLRDKNLSTAELTALAKDLKNICRRYGVLFIVNDRLDVALASGADGVHLGQADLPLPEAIKIVDAYFSSNRTDFMIGCSTHSLQQALEAQKLGADYIGCGPVFSTPTKPDYSAVGLDLVWEYRKKIQIPFVAIGGINLSNAAQVIGAGAECIAVVRAGFGSNDIESSVRSLKSKICQ